MLRLVRCPLALSDPRRVKRPMALTGEAKRAQMAARRNDPEKAEAERARNRTPKRRAKQTDGKRAWRVAVGSGSTQRPFCGVDGEGGNVSGRHEYLLLRAGTASLATGGPLQSADCLNLLASLPIGPTYVGYFFDYDVTMICRDLPAAKVARLLDRDARTRTYKGRDVTFPVDVDGFQLDYIPRKEFRVRRLISYDEVKQKPVYGRWRVVNDVGPFFQCAFIKALEEWDVGTPEQRAAIGQGKDARSDFGELTEDTDKYNALEIVLLQELMGRFRQVCVDVGYVPARWQGPGNIAVAMLRRNGAVKAKDLTVPDGMVEMAKNAYYGGRFETTRVGPCGPAYQYDINSAYPDAMLELPCLKYASYVRNGPVTRWTVSYGHFVATEHAALYGFPVRTKTGGIYYPAEGNGWYWQPEIDAAIHQTFTPSEWWTIEPGCMDCDPFGWIEPIYAQRLALGKSRQGRPLKLGLNSLYGKTCQSIGAAPYANPLYAGLITALTRAKLAGAAHGGPACCDDCYMLATDAVFTGHPRHLPITTDLGDWDATDVADLFIVQPGLYFTGGDTQPKTRGVPRAAVIEHRQDFYDAFTLMVTSANILEHRVEIPLKQFTGLRIANARGKLGTAGDWVTTPKRVSFEWQTKRDPNRVAVDPVYNGLVTVPKPGGPGVVTVPYSKDIGRLLERGRWDQADQPDWSVPLQDEREPG